MGGEVDAVSSELLEHSGVKRCVIAAALSKSVLEKVWKKGAFACSFSSQTPESEEIIRLQTPRGWGAGDR